MNLEGLLHGRVEVVLADGDRLYVSDTLGLKIFDIANPAVPVPLGRLRADGITAIRSSGDTVYLIGSPAGADPGMIIVDVGNPSNPVQIGYIDSRTFAGSRASAPQGGFAVSGAKAFIMTGDARFSDRRFSIIDISNAQQPRTITNFSAQGSAFAATDNFIYAVSFDGLRVINVSNPFMPSVSMVPSSAQPGISPGIFLEGNSLYVAGNERLLIYDITNPATPIQVGMQDLKNFAAGIGAIRPLTAKSGVVYTPIAGTNEAFGDQIISIDVANPATPIIRGSSRSVARLVNRDISASGRSVFVADENAGLVAIDYSDLTKPQVLSRVPAVGELPDQVVLAGSIAYVNGLSNGVHVIDISNPEEPRYVSNIFVPLVAPEDLAATNSLLFFTSTNREGLYIYDVREPTNPLLAGRLDINEKFSSLTISDNRVFLGQSPSSTLQGSGKPGFRAVDISDPSMPTLIGGLTTCCAASSHNLQLLSGVLDISNEFLYLVARSSSGSFINIFNIENPALPIPAGVLETDNDIQGFVLQDGVAYVSGRDSLRSIDLADPSAPSTLDFFSTGGSVRSAAGELLYVREDRVLPGFVRVLDIQRPESITEVQRIFLEEGGGIFAQPIDIAVDGAFGYITSRRSPNEASKGLLYVISLGDGLATLQ